MYSSKHAAIINNLYSFGWERCHQFLLFENTRLLEFKVSANGVIALSAKWNTPEGRGKYFKCIPFAE